MLNKYDEIEEKYKEYLIFIKTFIPNIKFDKESKKMLPGYDCKVNPHNYIYFTMKMVKEIEKRNLILEIPKKLFQCIPLRNSLIPSYITIDALIILVILNISTSAYNKEFPIKKDDNRIEKYWKLLFRMDKKIMQMQNYMICTIQTDGFGVSIVFQKILKKKGKKIKIKKMVFFKTFPKIYYNYYNSHKNNYK